MDQIEKELAAIEAQLRTITDHIKGNIVLRSIEGLPGVGSIVQWIEDALQAVESNVEGIAGEVHAQVASKVEGIIPDAIDLLGSLIDSLITTIQGVVSNLATAEDFATSVINVLRRYEPNLSRWVYDQLVSGLGNTTMGVLRTLELEHPESVDPMLDELLKIPHIPEWMRHAITGTRARGAPWMAFLLPALVLAILLPALGAMGEPVITAIKQGAFDQLPTKEAPESVLTDALLRGLIPDARWQHGMRQQGYNEERAAMFLRTREARLDPDAAARAYFRGDLSQPDYERELSDRGINPERANAFLQASRTLVPEPFIQAAWLRGIISDSQHDRMLGMYGITLENAELMRTLYFRIPDAPDLIHMAIRNVFTPEIVERFELFSDFPPAFKTAAQQQGISEYWAKNYWGAHWIVPSNTEGFEMFHRTLDQSDDPHADTFVLSDGTQVQNVIGRSTLQLLLREKDVAPYYRGKLTEVAYNPLTRIDVRRMHKVGVLSHAGVQRAYLDLGYSPANALRLADYVEKLNTIEAKDRSLPLTDALRKRIIQLYVQDKLDYNDASFAFYDLGFTDEEIAYFLAAAKVEQVADDAAAIESGIGRLYVAGYIKADAARANLQAAYVPEAGIARLFAKWNLQIQFDTEKRLASPTRDLSKTELLDAFKAGMLLEADVITLLDDLGYSDEESTVLVNLAKFQREKAARTAQTDALKALYINGVRERLDISNQLDALGMLVQQRDALLAEWDLLKEQRTEKLPLATLRDMVKRDILNLDEATAQLRRHRLSEDDIAKLIQLWGVQNG